MNLRTALPALLLSAGLGAQMVQVKPEGGGLLKIGETSYRFVVTDLLTASASGGLPGAIRLRGELRPQDHSRPFHLTLTLLKDGSLHLLQIERKGPGSYPDSWAATLKTRLRTLKLEDRPGGRIELECEGPLTGIISQRPQTANWSGRLWAVFPGKP